MLTYPQAIVLPSAVCLSNGETNVCRYETEERADGGEGGLGGGRLAWRRRRRFFESSNRNVSLSPLASKGRVESREFSDGRVIWQFTELPCSCSFDHATLPSLHVLLLRRPSDRPSFTPPVIRVFFNRLPRRRPIFHISGDL